MSRYQYVTADGGPHILLPVGVARTWKGVSSGADVMDPQSNYGRACAATSGAQMATIPVGAATAVVFSDPPMTASGKSADGLAEIYYLKSWTETDLDSLIAKASAAVPTASMTNSGSTLHFGKPDAYLLYAGDTPTSLAYSLHRIAIPPGKYALLTGNYSAKGEAITIYRLKPIGP